MFKSSIVKYYMSLPILGNAAFYWLGHTPDDFGGIYDCSDQLWVPKAALSITDNDGRLKKLKNSD